jgi:uncharacterized protein YdeI (YjbR/CyaY-like superfamily)
MEEQPINTFCPVSRQDWRQWLMENHGTQQSVWLVYYKKSADVATISWSEAVDEALCFGWIDSTRRSLGDDKFMQFFCKRKPKSAWSKINKEKVERLMRDGLIEKAGLECIETAKRNGSWSISDDVEETRVPQDLADAFKEHSGSADFFQNLSRSVRKMILQWITTAKRPETRQKRIKDVAESAAENRKPGFLTLNT